MKCERCFSGENAEFSVRTDIIDLKVCHKCAIGARTLGLAVEHLAKEPGLRTVVQKQERWGRKSHRRGAQKSHQQHIG